jgi:hypothetical protein
MNKADKIKFRGGTEVELNGKPFVIGVDTFDHGDCFLGYCDTNEAAIKLAQERGGEMFVTHAYDKDGQHLEKAGRF